MWYERADRAFGFEIEPQCRGGGGGRRRRLPLRADMCAHDTELDGVVGCFPLYASTKYFRRGSGGGGVR